MTCPTDKGTGGRVSGVWQYLNDVSRADSAAGPSCLVRICHQPSQRVFRVLLLAVLRYVVQTIVFKDPQLMNVVQERPPQTVLAEGGWSQTRSKALPCNIQKCLRLGFPRLVDSGAHSAGGLRRGYWPYVVHGCHNMESLRYHLKKERNQSLALTNRKPSMSMSLF